MKNLLPTFLVLLLACALALPGRVLAAHRPAAFSLSGRIVNHLGAPVPGAVVAVQGTTAAATTNSAGTFLLAVEQAAPVLVISCQGYQRQTLAVQGRNTLALTLYPVGVAAPLSAPPVEANVVAIANPALIVPDVQPAYPGGVDAYRAYLSQNARYPEAAQAAGKSGAVFVSFMVDEVGRILDAQVVKGCGYGLDEEALRLIRLMPWWTPGSLNGKPIKVACTLRIKFGVEEPAPRPGY